MATTVNLIHYKMHISKKNEVYLKIETDESVSQELSEFFKSSKHFSLEEAREEFLEEEYSDEELRISRIQFISNVGN